MDANIPLNIKGNINEHELNCILMYKYILLTGTNKRKAQDPTEETEPIDIGDALVMALKKRFRHCNANESIAVLDTTTWN